MRHVINARRQTAATPRYAVAPRRAIHGVADRAAYADGRRTGLDGVGILIATLADQTGGSTQTTFQQRDHHIIRLRRSLIETVIIDTDRAAGPHGGHTTVSKSHLTVAIGLR